jgi:hypothetical protein
MKVFLRKDADMIALGDWLELNVGPIWMRLGEGNATPTRPIHTPLSKGRRWVIEYDFAKKRQVLVLDGRKLKPRAGILRTELLLRFS